MNPPEFMTEIDRKVLLGLYHYKALTASQVKQLYFYDKKRYHYLKLHLLRKGGYAEAKPDIRYDHATKKVRKIASVYYITEKGVAWLSQYGEEVGRSVAAYDEWMWQIHRVDANMILLQLQEEGWRVWSKGEVEQEFDVSEKAYIDGAISRDGQHVSVYVLDPVYSESDLPGIATEIQEQAQRTALKWCLILYTSPSLSRQLGKPLGEKTILLQATKGNLKSIYSDMITVNR
jgi:hypothetical protein